MNEAQSQIDAIGPEQPLLQRTSTETTCSSSSLSHAAANDDTMAPSNGTRVGMLRAYYLGIVVCIGGFLFGYDSGIIGGVLTLKSYRHDYRYATSQATRVSSLAVGLQQLGAFVACFAIWPVTHRYGRRWAIVACSAIFILGAMIQTINTHSTTAFFIGRVIAGIGLGGSSVVVPMFSSEMTPKEIRGQVGSFYQLMYTLGTDLSFRIYKPARSD